MEILIGMIIGAVTVVLFVLAIHLIAYLTK